MNIRVAEEDFSLRLNSERSVAVRKGDIIVLYPQSLHMDPEIYEEPQVQHVMITNSPFISLTNRQQLLICLLTHN